MKTRTNLVQRELVSSIVGAFYEVYNYYGPGLLESVYAGAMLTELHARGHAVAREVRVPIEYKGRRIGWQRIDLVVDDKVIIEIKSSEQVPPFSERQLLTYLNATKVEVGLLLHFGLMPCFRKYVSTLDRRRTGPYAGKS